MKKIQDHYFHRAKKEGFAARSVYKLEQIDRKRRLLRAGMRVLDLGSAPGSWLQYAAGKVGSGGIVVGCDLVSLTGRIPLPATLVQADVFDEKAGELLATGAPYDLVLSDLAPKTTGVPSADAARSAALVRRALELATGIESRAGLLRPGGALLAKVFQGKEFPDLRKAFAECFEQVFLHKPPASRAESVEIFLLGMGRKG